MNVILNQNKQQCEDRNIKIKSLDIFIADNDDDMAILIGERYRDKKHNKGYANHKNG